MSFYVTTPIYYVNAAPHLGHAYTTIAADIMARHMRQRGEDVFFLTGTDEHGEPVADWRRRRRESPRRSSRTATPSSSVRSARLERHERLLHPYIRSRHKAKVQEVLTRVNDNGHVYKGLYEGWYCPRCADFKSRIEIAEGNTCPIHEIPLIRESEENYFFRLSVPGGARATVREPARLRDAAPPLQRGPRFIAGGLQDVSLTRGQAHVGRRGPVGPQPRLLRVVRRAAQLLHRAQLRARGRGSDRPLLAGHLPPRSARTSSSSTRCTGRRC